MGYIGIKVLSLGTRNYKESIKVLSALQSRAT